MPLALLSHSPHLATLKRPRDQDCSGICPLAPHNSGPGLPRFLETLNLSSVLAPGVAVPLHQRDNNVPDAPKVKRRLVSGNLRRTEQAARSVPCR